MPAYMCYGWDIQPHTWQSTDHMTHYRYSVCWAYHLNCLCICALESAINLCLAEVHGLAVNADALCDGIKGVLQPLAFRLLLGVHHASCHLQADAPIVVAKCDLMCKDVRYLVMTHTTAVPVYFLSGAKVGCLDTLSVHYDACWCMH